jgi:hypothetical protein
VIEKSLFLDHRFAHSFHLPTRLLASGSAIRRWRLQSECRGSISCHFSNGNCDERNVSEVFVNKFSAESPFGLIATIFANDQQHTPQHLLQKLILCHDGLSRLPPMRGPYRATRAASDRLADATNA